MEKRLKEASIDTIASFTTVPMEEDVAIVSAIGRRYFELIHKLDQLMPLFQTLEIEELVTETELDKMRAKVKRITGRPTSLARLLADKLRIEMRDPVSASQPAPSSDKVDDTAVVGADAATSADDFALPLSPSVSMAPQAIVFGPLAPSPSQVLQEAAEGLPAVTSANGTTAQA